VGASHVVRGPDGGEVALGELDADQLHVSPLDAG
jgi:DtxR family Mn-dependent transcriptional regulator